MSSRLRGQGKWQSASVIPPQIRDGSNWTYTAVVTGFTQPAAGANVTVTITANSWMVPGLVVYIANGGFYQVASYVPGATSVVLTNLSSQTLEFSTGTFVFLANPTGTIAAGQAIRVSLEYPLTLTTDSFSEWGLASQLSTDTTLAQSLIQAVQAVTAITQSTDVSFVCYPAGGPYAIGEDIRVYEETGTLYGALSGSNVPPCIMLPDPANPGEVMRWWSGSGPPIAGVNVGSSPTEGDRYSCRSSAYVVAASYATSGKGLSVGAGTLTHGTAVLSGAVEVGDLIVLVVADHAAQTTLSSPASASGATATSIDGGYTPTTVGGSEHVYFWSHVVQSADVSAGQVQLALVTNAVTTGIGVAYVFRHPNGWPTTGSFFGCPLSGTPAGGGASSANTTPISLAVTGSVTLPSVSVAAIAANAASTSDTFYWGNGFAGSSAPDVSAGDAAVCAKPGIGMNLSGQTNLPTGESSVVITPAVSTVSTAGLASWSPNSTPSSSLNPIEYGYNGSAWVIIK